MDDFEISIEKSIQSTSNPAEKAKLYRLYGYYFKLIGRIDAANIKWNKSNEYRSLAYEAYHYQLAWNHALSSSYGYEKFNPPLAKKHADSCLSLIQGLSEVEKLELEIHLIYNILGQSFKQSKAGLSYQEILNLYEEIQWYYRESIDFQLRNNLSKHTLANTYHLLANSYLDLSSKSKDEKDLKRYNLFYAQADSYYQEAIDIWTELYGDHHYEKGKTYFLLALLNQNFSKEDTEKSKLAADYFDKSINAYGVMKTGVNAVPNKRGLLMLFKYATIHKLRHNESPNFINEAEALNKLGIQVWREIITKEKSTSKNQNLSAYRLNPFEESLEILLQKKRTGRPIDNNDLFNTLQHLKNYDLLLANNLAPDKDVFHLKTLQNALNFNELFIDIQTIYNNKTTLMTIVSKDGLTVRELPYGLIKKNDTLIEAVINFDYETYSNIALEMYHAFFGDIDLKGKEIYICTDVYFQKTPFDALLVSDKDVKRKDYKKLDYFNNNTQISYVFNAEFIKKRNNNYTYSLNAYAPEREEFSKLPFSKKLVNSINNEKLGTGYLGLAANKENIIRSNSSILHLSGHGVIDQNESYFSELILANESLTLKDIYLISKAPKLAVINTCNSSLGRMYYGEGVNSFERAFSLIGSQSIMTNLWEVDDKASNEVMKLFYENLNEGLGSVESLREAKLSYVSNTTNSALSAPYYWSGHKLSGTSIKFTKEESKSNVYWLVFVVISITSLLGYVFFRRIKK